MAGNAQIGALHVALGLNSAQFTAGLKKAQKGLGNFGALAARSFAAVAAGATVAAGAMGVAVKGAIDHADALAKSAQKAGTTVEALSRLEYAAKLSDVSLEGLTGGLQKLSKTMADAVATPTSTAATAFKALGIALTDSSGKLRSSDAVFADVADRFARLEDGSTKTALAMQMFGKSGAEMIPLLNSGRDGLKAMADESDRLGITISTKTAKAAEKFNDTLTTIGQIMQGVVNKVMEAALPALQEFADLLASPRFAEAATSMATGVVKAMTLIADFITGLMKMLDDLADKINEGVARVNATPRQKSTEKLKADIAQRQGWLDSGAWLADPAKVKRDLAAMKAELASREAFGVNVPLGPNGRGGRTNKNTPVSPSAPPIAPIIFADKGASADAAKAMSDQLKAMNADLELQKQHWEDMQQPIRDTISAVSDGLSGAMSGLISDLIKGKDAVGGLINAFGNLGDRLIQMAMDQAIQGLLGSLFGAALGGGFNSMGMGHSAALGRGLTGGAVYGTGRGFYGIPSFDGGGFTGRGSGGGLDGKGGFLAMLHPNETVLDHNKGQSGTVMNFNITGSKQDAAAIANLVRQQVNSGIQRHQRNPGRL